LSPYLFSTQNIYLNEELCTTISPARYSKVKLRTRKWWK